MRFLYPKYRRNRLTAQRAGGIYNDQSNYCYATMNATPNRTMNTKKNSVSLIGLMMVVVLLLPGCMTGPKFSSVSSVPGDKALIYVYRKGNVLGSAASHKIVINGKHVTNMWTGGYYPYFADPGSVVMAMDLRATPFIGIAGLIEGEREHLRFTAEAGKTYYVKFKLGSGFGSPTMALVDEATGSREVRNCSMTKRIEE